VRRELGEGERGGRARGSGGRQGRTVAWTVRLHGADGKQGYGTTRTGADGPNDGVDEISASRAWARKREETKVLGELGRGGAGARLSNL
jgi:hypothetical protein